MASRGAPRIPSSDDSGLPAAAPAWPPRPRENPAKTTAPLPGASEICELRPIDYAGSRLQATPEAPASMNVPITRNFS